MNSANSDQNTLTMEKTDLQHVLVIDDDDVWNFIVQETFSDTSLQCNLTFKLSAQEALEYLESRPDDFPDLILLDINMPIMNGWDFLQEYEKRGYHRRHPTLIIMLSSSVYQEDKDKAGQFAKVVEYLEKPLTCEHIYQLQDTFLQSE